MNFSSANQPMPGRGFLFRSGICSGLSVILLCLTVLVGHTQDCALHGYLTETATQEPLVGASVYSPETGRGVITNYAGYYSLSLPCQTQQQVVFYQIGFSPDTLALALTRDSSCNVALQVLELAAVEVKAAKLQKRMPGQINMPVKTLARIPVMLGEPDLIKSLMLLPGFAPTTEGTAGLSVRGGSVDQNLITLDGSTIYNSGHLFGFISTFHPGVTKQVDTYKSFFPARYGGRLSSVIDVTMKDGDATALRWEANLGLINSSLLLEGPLANDKGSFLLAGRLAHSGILTLASLPRYLDGQNLLFAGLYDFNAKISWKLKRKAKLSLSLFAGDDFWGSRARQSGAFSDALVNWGNRAVGLRYMRPLGSRGFVNTRVNFNSFSSNLSASLRDASTNKIAARVTTKGAINEFGARHEYNWQLSRHKITLGLEGIYQSNNPIQTEITEEGEPVQSFDGGPTRSLQAAVYAEDTWSVSKAINFTLGARFSTYSTTSLLFPALEPRAAIGWQHNKQTWQLSYSRMVQPLHRAVTQGGSNALFYEYWLPATAFTRPQVGATYALRHARPWSGGQWSVEAFWREMSNQVEQRNNTTLMGVGGTPNAWVQDVYVGGKGRAYGVELWLEKQIGILNGWVAYTYSRSERQFLQINAGNWFPFDFDRPHDVELSLQYAWRKNWQFTANFVYQTGVPVNFPESYIRTIENRVRFVFAERNNGRLPDYHRLDLNAVYHFTTKRKGRDAKLVFGFYNIYGRANAVALHFGTQGISSRTSTDTALEVERLAIFQFVPALNYHVSW
ncbi:MAG: TonB-dependent receptor [bacterium]|nr:TonB-dependent receptor [bacterium]